MGLCIPGVGSAEICSGTPREVLAGPDPRLCVKSSFQQAIQIKGHCIEDPQTEFAGPPPVEAVATRHRSQFPEDTRPKGETALKGHDIKNGLEQMQEIRPLTDHFVIGNREHRKSFLFFYYQHEPNRRNDSHHEQQQNKKSSETMSE